MPCQNWLFPDWNLKYSVHMNHSYIFYRWQYVSRIVPSFSGQPMLKLLFSKISLFPSIAGTIILAQLSPASTLLRNTVGEVWVCVCEWVENPIKYWVKFQTVLKRHKRFQDISYHIYGNFLSSPSCLLCCVLFTGCLLVFILQVVKFHGHSVKTADDEPLFYGG